MRDANLFSLFSVRLPRQQEAALQGGGADGPRWGPTAKVKGREQRAGGIDSQSIRVGPEQARRGRRAWREWLHGTMSSGKVGEDSGGQVEELRFYSKGARKAWLWIVF